jgi:hypothetical protein
MMTSMPPHLHLVAIPLCDCGCDSALVVFETDADGGVRERFVDMMGLELAQAAIDHIARQACDKPLDISALPVAHRWPPLA